MLAVVEFGPLDEEGGRAANMLAAAPQMLEALEAVDDLLNAQRMDTPIGSYLTPGQRQMYELVHAQVRAALTAARGEQQ